MINKQHACENSRADPCPNPATEEPWDFFGMFHVRLCRAHGDALRAAIGCQHKGLGVVPCGRTDDHMHVTART